MEQRIKSKCSTIMKTKVELFLKIFQTTSVKSINYRGSEVNYKLIHFDSDYIFYIRFYIIILYYKLAIAQFEASVSMYYRSLQILNNTNN